MYFEGGLLRFKSFKLFPLSSKHQKGSCIKVKIFNRLAKWVKLGITDLIIVTTVLRQITLLCDY